MQYRDLASVRNLILTTRHPFWNQFFAPGQKTVIVAGDSSLAVWQELMKRNLGLADYLSANYRSNTTSQPTTKEQEAAYLATRRYTSIVDLEIIQSFSHIEQARQYSTDIRYARDLRPNDFKQNNIVLIGTAETNPWVQLFEREMNFVFSKDRMAQTYSIINRKPSMNEPSAWVYKETDEQHRVYGLVAYQPNIGTSKNVLILEGTAMAGTECASDFITDERQLIPFLKKIERKDGTIPHFEVVLGTNNINGSAVKSSILAWRTSP